MSLLRLEGASFGYGRRAIVEDVSLEVPEGGFLGIIGPNGSGKTTLLRGLVGLLPPLAGRRVAPHGAPRIGSVRQRQRVDPLAPLSVRDVVRMGRLGLRRGLVRRESAADREAVERALETTGLAAEASRSYATLSGGMAQRVLIARALASEPQVLVLDEPTNDLDLGAEERMLRLLESVRSERGLAVVLVSHLLHVVLGMADTLALVGGGRARVGPTSELATDTVLSEFYGLPVTVAVVAGRRTAVPRRPEGAHG